MINNSTNNDIDIFSNIITTTDTNNNGLILKPLYSLTLVEVFFF